MSVVEPLHESSTDPASGRVRRRRRSRRPNARGFAVLLPHVFTTGNLAAGFYAIVKASEGQYGSACVALIVAAIFDGLDGRVARMANATSRFGVEYDSISDTVSFGVAPAILAFNAGHFSELGWTGWVLAFMYTACAALRLARFNVSPGRYRGRFEGLPSPPACGMVLSAVLFAHFMKENGISSVVPESLAAIGVAVLGLLMVSPIPYRSFKEVQLRGNYRSIVLMVVTLLVLLMKPEITLFLIGIVYVASGPVEWVWRWRTGQELEELPPPEPIAAGPEGGASP